MSVILRWIDIIFISFDSPVSGPKFEISKKNYSFLILTFAFRGVKGLFALSLLHLSGTKGLHVFFTFTCGPKVLMYF